jgi:hypothetical protein
MTAAILLTGTYRGREDLRQSLAEMIAPTPANIVTCSPEMEIKCNNYPSFGWNNPFKAGEKPLGKYDPAQGQSNSFYLFIYGCF